MDITIKKVGINGEGIGYFESKPVFVKNACLDEVVEIEVTEKMPKYWIAKTIKIKKASPHRIPAKCRIQGSCGGCALMVYDYPTQLTIKKDLLCEALKKYAGISHDLVEDVIASDKVLGYRNQCKLPIKNIKDKLCSGLYEANSNHLLVMDDCIIHDKKLDKIRKNVMDTLNKHKCRDYYEGTKTGIKNVVVRGDGSTYQCAIVTGNNDLAIDLVDDLLEIENITSLYQNQNTFKYGTEIFSTKWIHLGKNKNIILEVNDLKLKLSCASFFQLNTTQAKKLYNLVYDQIKPGDLLVEAYCGVGAMSLMMSDKFKNIIGIEYSKVAVHNATENAFLNKIKNCKFIAEDAAEELTKISKRSKIDTLLVDPPRTGLDDSMLDTIIRSKISNIVYISCNPATLAKNLKDLSMKYEVKRIMPVDMFPNTPHVETIVVLKRKK